jgi:hypothetical protein
MRSFSASLFVAASFFLSAHARASDPTERRIVIFYTAEAHGKLEPCGCTSDPLGDFARVTALVRSTAGRTKSTILVDAGNLVYSEAESTPRMRPIAELRSRFIADEITKLPFGGSALGDSDCLHGKDGVMPKRLAVNLPPAAFTEASRLRDVGGVRLGVLGIADPAAAAKLGLVADDPAESSKREVARLRAAGAEIVIVLAPVERATARSLARTAGADFVVVGKNVGQGMASAEAAGRGYLVAPADEMQRVGRLEVVLRGNRNSPMPEPLVDGGSAEQQKLQLADLDRRLQRLDADLARWRAEAASDRAFVAGKERERESLAAERARLAASPWRAPASGSYFTNSLIPIRRSLPRDPTLAASMHKLDRAIGAANLRMAEPPPPAEPGRAFYVGQEKCVSCHKPAARQWKHTIHAQAWKTLVDVGKEAHEDCVSCHVTGYGEVGGSSLGYTKGLQNVQCETCHGPGSTHVEKRGKESPLAVVTKTPESVCVRCHNEKHSDTFEYKAYLRDVLGPGHGELARDELGDGPTGHSLRHAAEVKARREAAQRRP